MQYAVAAPAAECAAEYTVFERCSQVPVETSVMVVRGSEVLMVTDTEVGAYL